MPALPSGVYRCTPLVEVAVEMNDDGRRKPFWMLVHSVTDRGLKRLLNTGTSHSRGQLYETQAESQHHGPNAGSILL